MNSIDNLFRGFSLPNLWNQVFDDIRLGLSDYSFTFLQLCSKLVVFRPCNHSLLLGLLSESRVGVFVFPVRVFPKSSDEGFAFFRIS